MTEAGKASIEKQAKTTSAITKKKLESLTAEHGVIIDGSLIKKIYRICYTIPNKIINKLPRYDVKRIFWEQQVCLYICIYVHW